MAISVLCGPDPHIYLHTPFPQYMSPTTSKPGKIEFMIYSIPQAYSPVYHFSVLIFSYLIKLQNYNFFSRTTLDSNYLALLRSYTLKSSNSFPFGSLCEPPKGTTYIT